MMCGDRKVYKPVYFSKSRGDADGKRKTVNLSKVREYEKPVKRVLPAGVRKGKG